VRDRRTGGLGPSGPSLSGFDRCTLRDSGGVRRAEVTEMLSVWQVPVAPPPAAGPAQSGTAGSGAFYTLLGVVITAVVTLAGILVKYWLDQVSDRHRFQRELEKLRLELTEARADSLRESRRKVAASLIAGTHEIYLEIVDARRARREGGGDEAYLHALRSVQPLACQTSLEEWRLIGSGDAARCADLLWHHLRTHPVPRGHELGAGPWQEWKTSYWTLRSAFVESCRADVLA
jgi:hypothetical protein